MLLAGLAALQLTGGGHAEALPNAFVRLHLGHGDHHFECVAGPALRQKRKAPGRHQGSRSLLAKPFSQVGKTYSTETSRRGEGRTPFRPAFRLLERASPSCVFPP